MKGPIIQCSFYCSVAATIVIANCYTPSRSENVNIEIALIMGYFITLDRPSQAGEGLSMAT